MKHEFEEKLDVVRKILSGRCQRSVCIEHRLDVHAAYSWLLRYKAHGEDGLRQPAERRHLTAEEKVRIVSEHMEKGVSLSRLSLQYDLSRETIKSWLRTVRSGGSLYDVRQRGDPKKDPMARPKKKEPQTELEKLQAENLRLRAENALLKKVKALVEEQEARARLSGRKPSTD